MSNRTIHFVCGLPRSGSTLLCNLLAQHPDVHTTPTSACHEALFVMRNNWYEWIEHKASKELADEKNLQRVLNNIIHSYHDTDKPVVIDKGRGWTSLLETAEFALNRKAKVLVPVRNISQIVASLEKMHRKNIHRRKDIGNYITAQTVEGRGIHHTSEGGVVGLAYNRLKDAIQRGFGDRLYLVEFEHLTHHPEQTMAGIWQFLEMDPVKHNFDNVEQVTFEDDNVHLMDGLHTIKNKVRPVLDDSLDILGRQYYETLRGAEFWRKPVEVSK